MLVHSYPLIEDVDPLETRNPNENEYEMIFVPIMGMSMRMRMDQT
jgi:hypothetical protein